MLSIVEEARRERSQVVLDQMLSKEKRKNKNTFFALRTIFGVVYYFMQQELASHKASSPSQRQAVKEIQYRPNTKLNQSIKTRRAN